MQISGCQDFYTQNSVIFQNITEYMQYIFRIKESQKTIRAFPRAAIKNRSV